MKIEVVIIQGIHIARNYLVERPNYMLAKDHVRKLEVERLQNEHPRTIVKGEFLDHNILYLYIDGKFAEKLIVSFKDGQYRTQLETR